MRFVLSILFVLFLAIEGMKVIPERSEVLYVNHKYITWATLKVQRYSRRGDYYFHIEGENKHMWNDNVTIDLAFNEYLHNEFRPSFIRITKKLCDLLNNEKYVGSMIKKAGIECPMVAKQWHLMNLTVPSQNFPNVFPFKKGQVIIFVNITETGENMAHGYFVVSFVQNPEKKRGLVGRKKPPLYDRF